MIGDYEGFVPMSRDTSQKHLLLGDASLIVSDMDEEQKLETGRWLRRRDAWMRQLVSDSFVSRNGKLTGVHVALRLSAKKPYTYPAMKTMAKQLDVSTRQIARALKELEDEQYIRVRRVPGKTNYYSLDL